MLVCVTEFPTANLFGKFWKACIVSYWDNTCDHCCKLCFVNHYCFSNGNKELNWKKELILPFTRMILSVWNECIRGSHKTISISNELTKRPYSFLWCLKCIIVPCICPSQTMVFHVSVRQPDEVLASMATSNNVHYDLVVTCWCISLIVTFLGWK